jgi:hypothetical protein
MGFQNKSPLTDFGGSFVGGFGQSTSFISNTEREGFETFKNSSPVRLE